MFLYKVARFIAGAYVKVFYRAEIIGRENEPKEGGCIVIANHTSLLDPIAVAIALRRDVYFLGKSEWMKNKFMKWVFKMCNVVPINRGESDIAALRKVCEIVGSGNVTGIFPQGTRIECERPEVESALPGIGLIAARSKAPILPVALCYGKNNKKPKFLSKMRIVVCEPVPYEEYAFVNGEKAGSHEISKYAFSKVCEAFTGNNP